MFHRNNTYSTHKWSKFVLPQTNPDYLSKRLILSYPHTLNLYVACIYGEIGLD